MSIPVADGLLVSLAVVERVRVRPQSLPTAAATLHDCLR